MPKASSKEPREDSSQASARTIRTVNKIEDPPDEPVEITPEMRAAAAAFGRMGGKIGGSARAAKLSAERRIEIARQAATTRWKK